MSHKVTAKVGGGEIHIESGKIAKQADGSVTVQLGETIVLVAACGSAKPRPGLDFFPLTVDYREKAAACLLYTSPSPRDRTRSRMPSSA